MNFKGLVLGLSVFPLLAGCGPVFHKADPEQNFKPYIADEMHAIPMAYPPESWAYPTGTSTQEIVKRWRLAGLVDGVRTEAGYTAVIVGPQFYNLSYSSQQGLADAVAQMYAVQSFRLQDKLTKKTVGNYSSQGLQLY